MTDPGHLQTLSAQLAAMQVQVAALVAGNDNGQDGSPALSDNQDPISDASTERKPMRRINGPYRHRSKWRVVDLDTATKKKAYHVCATEEEATALFDQLKREAARQAGASIDQVLALYRRRIEIKNRPASVVTTLYRIRAVLDGVLHRPITAVTRADLEKSVARMDARAGDTRLNAVAETRTFLRWARQEGHVRADLAALLKVEANRRQVPKATPRIDEARKVVTRALALAAEGDAGATGVVMLVLLGLRASEVVRRTVNDLDDEGRVLWIPHGKTANAARRLRVPEVLQGPLRALAGDRSPEALLFVGSTRHWMTYHAKRLCRLTGVRTWRPHAWRRLHSTLAVEAGTTSAAVARALGHGSFRTTARSYADPGAVEGARNNVVAGELGFPICSPETAVDNAT